MTLEFYKSNKYLAVVNENGWKDSKKILEKFQEKYGKDITVNELLNLLNKEVLILN